MFSVPQLPDWNSLHVLVIHFPIALLLLASPALLFIAMFTPKHAKPLAAAAGLILALGTGLCYLATQTGEAAEHLAQAQGVMDDQQIHATLEKHAQMATQSRNYFTIFTAVFLLYLLVIGTRKDELHPVLNSLLLLLFFAGNAVLALGLGNAAHAGGELVHSYGITALLEPGAGEAAAAAAAGSGAPAEHESGADGGGNPPAPPPTADID
jgi:heme A synthase